jgi:photosystem II stability/assembly factor-like uncharacterized protein
MKTKTEKIFYVIITILSLTTIIEAQWEQISTVPTLQLYAVKFINQYTGFTVGMGGIWKSTSSGMNWYQVLNSLTLYSLSFSPDMSECYAVGDSGRIYRTTNNGENWVQQTSPTTLNIYSVYYSSNSRCCAVGQNGMALCTYSRVWYIVSYSHNEDLFNLYMTNETDGFAVGSTQSELCTSTANSGANWLQAVWIHNSTYRLNSVISMGQSGSIVLCVGNNGRIRRSTNWGLSWTLPNSPTTQNLNCIAFSNTTTGWICGNTGKILITIDGGIIWNFQTTNTNNNLSGLSFINTNTGWAVGSNGIVLRTGIPVGIEPAKSKNQNFILYQNYPNPFNPVTTISYNINKTTNIKLSVYDCSGKEIEIIKKYNVIPGYYEINWPAPSEDGKKYSSGIYYYQLMTNDYRETRKMMLLK